MLLTNKIIIISFTLILFSCSTGNNKIADIPLKFLDDSEVHINDVDRYLATVITFLSPECPVSENYTGTLNEIQDQYGPKINFINVFPGTYYTNDNIQAFVTKYRLKQLTLKDEDLILVDYLNATITPETFVLNSEGKIIYSGAIDNWAVDAGGKRQVITEFYLEDALYALMNEQKLKVKHTDAVGCFIEVNN